MVEPLIKDTIVQSSGASQQAEPVPDDFDYTLPQELIAQYPPRQRGLSRLMVLHRSSGAVMHRGFSDIKDFMSSGDALVLNDTKVIPARLLGRKPTGGRVELFLIREEGDEGGLWICLLRASKGIRQGLKIFFESGLEAELVNKGEDGLWRVSLSGPGPVRELIEKTGSVPLPPYIKREAGDIDRDRYQTVYAKRPGAVAAPTAGLHFTEGLLEEIGAKGVRIFYVTLHTGPGTFMPPRPDGRGGYRIHEEYFRVDKRVLDGLLEVKRGGGRVFVVGTTTTRALESAVLNGLSSPRYEGFTDLFIRPGFRFRLTDALVTNFHLPRSSLIMLVSAFAGRGPLMSAYKEAVERRYRFYSYGDAMLII